MITQFVENPVKEKLVLKLQRQQKKMVVIEKQEIKISQRFRTFKAQYLAGIQFVRFAWRWLLYHLFLISSNSFFFSQTLHFH